MKLFYYSWRISFAKHCVEGPAQVEQFESHFLPPLCACFVSDASNDEDAISLVLRSVLQVREQRARQQHDALVSSCARVLDSQLSDGGSNLTATHLQDS